MGRRKHVYRNQSLRRKADTVLPCSFLHVSDYGAYRSGLRLPPSLTNEGTVGMTL